MKLFFHLLVFFLVLFSLVPHGSAAVVDRVVAIVNDDVITLSEVNEEGKPLLQRVMATVSPAERDMALQKVRQNIIEKMIEKKIMQQEAARNNITVSKEDVEKTYERLLARNNATPEQFRAELEKAGLTEEQYKKNLRDQILSSKLVNTEVRSKVIITEDKLIDYYDTHYTERVAEGGFYLLQIGISPDGKAGATREDARQEAERIRKLALAGEDFRNLARQFSDLPSSEDGGDIGVLQKDDMSNDMLKVIANARPGEITDIIETPAGFQFFKILSSQDGQIITKVPYESVKDDIYETLYQEEMRRRFNDWLREKREQAYIKIL